MQKVMSTKANGQKIKLMDMEYTLTSTAADMRVNGLPINNMASELSNGLMELNMMANTSRE